MNVGIIGGTDGLGKTLVYYFRNEFEVYITGTNHKKGRKVAEELDVSYIESNAGIANICDMVIVSVPIQHTSSVIREVAPFMKSGSVMIDVTSIKEEPSKTMAEVLPGTVEYIPTHPVFGPRTTRLDNQVIVLTADKKGKWYKRVYDYLSSKNMRIIETTAEKHDFMMSIVQVLTHFSFISTASAIEKLKVDLTESEDYESPIYNLMIDMIARIVSQNPYLTYNIQSMNSNGPHIRNTFAEAVTELRDVINAKDEEKFVEIAINATKHMGDITNALGRSDKAINALTQEFNRLKDSIGEEIALKHIYSKTVHIGVLEDIDYGFAILRTKSGKIKKLKISNIRILNEKEVFEWRLANEKILSASLSCLFPANSNPEIIRDTLSNIKNMSKVEIVETYDGPQIKEGEISYTFIVESFEKEAIKKAKDTLKGFGGILR